MAVGRAVAGAGVGGADAENALAAAELSDPGAVAAVIAVAGVAQRPGVRVHHTEDAEAAVRLADDAAGDGLGVAVEMDVGNTGVALHAGRQRRQNGRLVALPVSQKDPAGFVVATDAAAVRRVLFEQGPRDLVGQDDTAQGPKVRQKGECQFRLRHNDDAAAARSPPK